MGFFTRIAEKSFITDDEGRRVFFFGAPFPRIYIMPDADTESRLCRTLAWHQNISTVVLYILFCVLVFMVDALRHPWTVFGVITGLFAMHWIVLRCLFATHLRRLCGAPTRLSLRTCSTKVGIRGRETGLIFASLGSTLGVLVGLRLLFAPIHFMIPVAIILSAGACAAASAHALDVEIERNASQS